MSEPLTIKTQKLYLHRTGDPVLIKLVYNGSENNYNYGYRRGYFIECSRGYGTVNKTMLLHVLTRKTPKNLAEAEKLYEEKIKDYITNVVLPYARTNWSYGLRKNYY